MMFQGASAFNQDVGPWNVGRVTYVYKMFDGVPAATMASTFPWDSTNVTKPSSSSATDYLDWNVACPPDSTATSDRFGPTFDRCTCNAG